MELTKLAKKYQHLLPPEASDAKLQAQYSELKFLLKEKLSSGTVNTFADFVSFVLTDVKFKTSMKGKHRRDITMDPVSSSLD